MGSASSTPDPAVPPVSGCPFLKLPPELRIQIYHFALLSDHDQVQPSNGKDFMGPVDFDAILKNLPRKLCAICLLPVSNSSYSGRRRTNLDILLVCRQIHEEAECIWYAKTCLAFRCPIDAIQFFETLGENRRMAVTRVAFQCPHGSDLAGYLYALWFYLLRTGTLMNPKWLAVGIPANYSKRNNLKEVIENIVIRVPLSIREAPGGLYRCGRPPCVEHWYPGGIPVTDVVPWKNIAEPFETFAQRLTANDFFLEKSN